MTKCFYPTSLPCINTGLICDIFRLGIKKWSVVTFLTLFCVVWAVGQSLAPPQFSLTSGFYDTHQTLIISHEDPEVTILYTLDGSVPNPEKIGLDTFHYKNRYPEFVGSAQGELLPGITETLVYEDALTITNRSSEPNSASAKSSTNHYTPTYLPTSPVRKATVVKARAVKGGEVSDLVTHTYFLWDDGTQLPDLPVVSMSLDERHLFEYEEGVHCAGIDFDNWRIAHPLNPVTTWADANYGRRGDETEKPACLQLFVDGQEVLSQNMGLRIHGGVSRTFPQKSLRLYARNEYGDNRFQYPIFGPDNSTSFKRLLLRNAGNDSEHAYMRDAVVQTLSAGLRFETQDYQPAVVYLNGEYWGILNFRERYDHHYFERRFGIDENDLDHLTIEINVSASDGTTDHYDHMIDYVGTNDLSNPTVYD